MYAREVGLKKLAILKASGNELSGEKGTMLKIAVRAYGYERPSDDDCAIFSDAFRYVRIGPPSTSDHTFDMDVYADRFVSEEGRSVERAPEDGALNGFETTTRLLLCMSVATSGIFRWRRLEVSPTEIVARDLVNAKDLPVQIASTGGIDGTFGPLHVGHLSCAIDLFVKVGSWHQRFFQLYQKGEMLLELNEWPMLSFFEDAYLCFFKCLEYAVMVKILDKRGQLDPKLLKSALERIGATGSNLMKTSTHLVSERGSKTAHLLKGYEELNVTRQAVFELKQLLDALVRGAALGAGAAVHTGIQAAVPGEVATTT